MDNFDDVEQEVMFHDADDVSAVVRELVEMPLNEVEKFPESLKAKALVVRAAFNYWNEVLHEKAQQKRIIHRYGQAGEE